MANLKTTGGIGSQYLQTARASLLAVAGGGGLEGNFFNLGSASYSGNSFSVSSQTTSTYTVRFGDSGNKMYVTSGAVIYQYNLSTAFDITTASYASKSLTVSGEDTAVRSFFFKDDGTKLYTSGASNDAIFQYTLSTAWDISTGSYDSVTFSVGTQETSPFGLFFKDDGSKMYVCGFGNDINEYDLSTAWDLSTASYLQTSASSGLTLLASMSFNRDGTKILLLDNNNDTVYEYNVGTAWDVSTINFTSVASFSVGTQEATPWSITFNTNGSKMYVGGTSSNTIYEYLTE